MENLEELNLAQNKLLSVPDELIQLKKLEKLYLNDNSIEPGTIEHEKLKVVMKVFNERKASINFDF